MCSSYHGIGQVMTGVELEAVTAIAWGQRRLEIREKDRRGAPATASEPVGPV